MKSPAVNFYTSDFLTGTTFFTNKEVGGYIRLLCYQHQLGHLEEEKINSILSDFDDKEKQKVLSKFCKDKNDLFYNKRMELEITKKKKYSESRSNNRKKKKSLLEDKKNICNSYDEHMENEIVIIIENKNINIDINYIIKFIENNFLITVSSYIYSKLENWIKDYDEKIVLYALMKTLDAGVKNFNYTEGILKNWKKDNLNSIEKILEEEKKVKKQKFEVNEELEQTLNELEDYNWFEGERKE